jgi:hypothetical protein
VVLANLTKFSQSIGMNKSWFTPVWLSLHVMAVVGFVVSGFILSSSDGKLGR